MHLGTARLSFWRFLFAKRLGTLREVNVMNNQGERVTAVFEAAVLLEPDERLPFVREACGEDANLRRQVESMLADVDQPVVIDRPVDEAIADLMDDDTPVAVGTQFGPYRVESLLGAGGMGTVYRATDTVLGRQVAIKILPTDVAADPERVARFRREAQALAALNHPNVGAIYGFESVDGRPGSAFGLVLELVDGPTLAEKLEPGALPVEEALAVAQQIAEALEGAHQRGIVHRDLKPGNIKIRDDGTVKVLDFGLAQIAAPSANAHQGGPDAGQSDLPSSPTIATPGVTTAGTILGTPAYMSPEQAKGNMVTRTTDIWAFGCVLYEMLTGSVPFKGDGATDTLALIVRGEPDFGLLPATTPLGIRTLLRHCLNKDQRRRWQDAGSLRIAIEDARAAPADVATAADVARPVNWRWMIASAFAVLVAAAFSALGAWSLARQERPRAVARVLVGVSPARQIARTLDFPNVRPFRSAIALSPDGQSLAFIGALPDGASGSPAASTAARQLYVRRMDRLNAMPIEGTDRAESPFFSPDGQWIGFWQAGPSIVGRLTLGELKKVPVAGGPVVTVCRTELPAGISWGANGRIIFANHSGGGLWQVADAGGTPEALTTPDLAKGELSHRLPHVLPDGRAVLFTIQRSPGGWDDTQVAVRSLVTGEQKRLVEGAADARYVTSGHIVYARMGTLLAQPFDVTRLEIAGKPVGVVEDVMQDVNSRFTIGNSGTAQFSVASNGTLAYLPGGVAPEGQYVAMWVDRNGGETEVGIPTQSAPSRPRISPDGRRIAFPSLEGIGIFDVARPSFQLLTSSAWGSPTIRSASELRFVAWHPDGERITFTGVDGDLYWMRADGNGEAERLTTSDANARSSQRLQVPTAWSPDGRTLIFTQRLGFNRDIWALTLGDSVLAARPFLASAADEPSAELSPDGRYLAYESNQSGRAEVYVQPFPGSGRREVVSIDGGVQPAWARNGRELFYRVSQGAGRPMQMMAVDVSLGDVFTAKRPRVLWEAMGSRYPGGTGGRTYDVAPDGRRFLMVQQRDAQPQPPITHVVLVQNWLDELTRLVPRD
jgi:serine/threonine protein kinase/Tol biopolymer transport system component